MIYTRKQQLTVLLRRIFHDRVAGQEGTADSQTGLDDGFDRDQIVCRRCGLLITSAGQRIEVNGSHEHSFTNPEGIVFHIGCFARVQGCLFVGGPTFQWSWFSGYAWTVACCAGCGSHLGWRFVSADDVFHGLVLRSIIIVS